MDEATKTGSPSVFCAIGSEAAVISEQVVSDIIGAFLESVGSRQDVLLLPPDFTRYHSKAGTITQLICNHYGYTGSRKSVETPPTVTILPALGTHSPMTSDEIRKMYGVELADMEPSPFRVHDWRNDVVTIGEAPASMVAEATNGLVEKPWPAQLNRLVWQKRKSLHDHSKQKDPSLVISIGQVVPHEVMVSTM
jgi:nickel-dependent lactate racemase